MPDHHCPFCAAADVFAKYDLGTHQILRCRGCTMMWLEPQPAPEALGDVYDEKYFANKQFFEGDNQTIYGYFDYLEERQRKQQAYQSLIKEVRELLPGFQSAPSRLLDVGCGLGYLMDVAQDAGFDVQGIDVNPSAIAAIRRKFQFPVVLGDLSTLDAQPFDVVMMMDVIEHLLDPFSTLKHVNRLTNLGGLAVISTMDCDSLVSRMMGARLEDFRRVREHLFFFTRKSLSAVLEQAGFAVLRSRFHGHTFRLDALAERVRMMSPLAGTMLTGLTRITGLGGLQINLNPMTKFLVVAQKRRGVRVDVPTKHLRIAA